MPILLRLIAYSFFDYCYSMRSILKSHPTVQHTSHCRNQPESRYCKYATYQSQITASAANQQCQSCYNGYLRKKGRKKLVHFHTQAVADNELQSLIERSKRGMEGTGYFQFCISTVSFHHCTALLATCFQFFHAITAQAFPYQTHIQTGQRQKRRTKQKSGKRFPNDKSRHHQQYQHRLSRHAKDRSQYT